MATTQAVGFVPTALMTSDWHTETACRPNGPFIHQYWWHMTMSTFVYLLNQLDEPLLFILLWKRCVWQILFFSRCNLTAWSFRLHSTPLLSPSSSLTNEIVAFCFAMQPYSVWEAASPSGKLRWIHIISRRQRAEELWKRKWRLWTTAVAPSSGWQRSTSAHRS